MTHNQTPPADPARFILQEAEVELNASALLALGQQTDSFAKELSELRLDLNKTDDGCLKQATLLIGLRKAPNTLFSGRYPVSDVIGELNTHSNPIVAQYSFWATVENPSLGLANVRVRPADFIALPPNVQGWAYRTLTKNRASIEQHYDTILAASDSKFSEVRGGVASGLRDVFIDGFDVYIADWLLVEQSPEVRDGLLEHMAVHVDRSGAYREEVMRAYREAGSGSVLRTRLEAAAGDEQIRLEMRRISLHMEEPGLLEGIMGATINNTINFNAAVSAAGISNSGVGNQGPVQIISPAEAQAAVLPILQEVEQALKSASIPTAVAAPGIAATQAAMTEPTKGKVEKVLDWLKSIKDGGEAVASIAAWAGPAYDKLLPYAHYLASSLP